VLVRDPSAQSDPPPDPSVPPPVSIDEPWIGEEELDWRENQQRTSGERWRVDLVLFALCLIATGVLVAGFVMGRYWFHR